MSLIKDDGESWLLCLLGYIEERERERETERERGPCPSCGLDWMKNQCVTDSRWL
ncbi:MAG: hypothetical protein J8272_00310 ['Prunus persica' phytoplasma PP2]|nr:hypothetical protein ['Prunus persica' phytoplasma PP2]